MEDNFNIRHEKVIPGYMQALFLTPKNEDSLFLVPFTILNVYLLSGSDTQTAAHRASMLKTLETFDPQSNYLIAGGDWNLTEFPSDSSAPDHFASGKNSRAALVNALNAQGLKDIFQPAVGLDDNKTS